MPAAAGDLPGLEGPLPPAGLPVASAPELEKALRDISLITGSTSSAIACQPYLVLVEWRPIFEEVSGFLAGI